MKLALLKGNRFNPWHLQGYARLPQAPEVTLFRAESEIQRHFDGRAGGGLGFNTERIYFDTQRGNPLARAVRLLQTRYAGREPGILPFAERLRGFDVVQSWELFTDWSAQAAEARDRYGTPLAVMVWDNIPFNMERNPVRRAIKRRVAQRADRFIVHTERSRRMLTIEGLDPARIEQFDPGIDLDAFAPGPGGRARLGVDPEDFVILFVGWLLPRKGIDFLVLALRELLNDATLRSHRPRLVMVGSGPGRDRVERLIERLDLADACRFAGAVAYEDMPAVYRAADVFVLPSIAMPDWQEQFGMALIEAMACGLPVIATQSGAIPEIAGDAAVLCQPNDFLALYEAVKQLMLDAEAREERAARSRDTALRRFSLDAYAQALGAVYAGMLT